MRRVLRVVFTCWEGVKAGVLWLLPAGWIVAATASIVFLVGKVAEMATEKAC